MKAKKDVEGLIWALKGARVVKPPFQASMDKSFREAVKEALEKIKRRKAKK